MALKTASPKKVTLEDLKTAIKQLRQLCHDISRANDPEQRNMLAIKANQISRQVVSEGLPNNANGFKRYSRVCDKTPL